MATLLVVDDDAVVRRHVACLLEGVGHQLHTAANGVEAARVAGSRACDVVLIGDRIGVGSGLDVIETMRLIQPEVPVVVFSSNGSIRDAIASIKAGAFDYVERLTPAREILRVVECALRRRSASSSAGSGSLESRAERAAPLLHALAPPGESGGLVFATATLEAVERAHILRVIAQSKTLEQAAAVLGIDITTLWRKRRRYRRL